MSFDLMGGLCYKKTKNEKGIQKTIMNGKVVHSLIALCVETSEKKKREIATSFHPEHPIFYEVGKHVAKKVWCAICSKIPFR